MAERNPAPGDDAIQARTGDAPTNCPREQERARHRTLCERAKSASDAYLAAARSGCTREEFNRLEREFRDAMRELREFLEAGL